ncbi:MAG: hypothetical protein AAB495_04260 [Patescibacteria group bacterium]
MPYVERSDEEICGAILSILRSHDQNALFGTGHGNSTVTVCELIQCLETDRPAGIREKFIELHRGLAKRLNEDPLLVGKR